MGPIAKNHNGNGDRTKTRTAKERHIRLPSDVQLDRLRKTAKYGEHPAERREAATRLIGGVGELKRAINRTVDCASITELRARVGRATYMVEMLFDADDPSVRLKAAEALLDDGIALRLMRKCKYSNVRGMAERKLGVGSPDETSGGSLPLPKTFVRGRRFNSWA